MTVAVTDLDFLADIGLSLRVLRNGLLLLTVSCRKGAISDSYCVLHNSALRVVAGAASCKWLR